MLENLRRKAITNTYKSLDNLNFKMNLEKGLVIYDQVCMLDIPKQRLSKSRVKKSFLNILDTIPISFRLIEDSCEGVLFNMICCSRGSFMAGHQDEKNNQPRICSVGRSFLLGETEVTQELYSTVMPINPSEYSYDSENPVDSVSWDDAIRFCNKLSESQGFEQCYTKSTNSKAFGWACDFTKNGYRLPTEDEWEYAAKAGTQNKWSGTNKAKDLHLYAFVDYVDPEEEDEGSTSPVKSKYPNEWGFYDMSGNVSEWCWDILDSNVKNFREVERIIKGGGAADDEAGLRIASRSGYRQSGNNCLIGFRLCRSIV